MSLSQVNVLEWLTYFHAANYGENALEFFNDAVSALRDKLTAANQSPVLVGVPKDVSPISIKII